MIKLKYLLKDNYFNNEFMSEACAIFAIALHDMFRYPIEILWDDRNDTVAHVYTRYGTYGIDVLGKRDINKIKLYYHDIIPRSEQVSKTKLLSLMDNSDDKPLYSYDAVTYKKAIDIINKNINKYKI